MKKVFAGFVEIQILLCFFRRMTSVSIKKISRKIMSKYTILAIVSTVIVILLFAIIKMYNGLVVLKNRIDNQGT